MSRTKLIKFVVALSGFAVLYIFFLEDRYILSSSANQFSDLLKPKTFLIWNSYWHGMNFWPKIFQQIVNKECPLSNCKFTMNRSDLFRSDAVLFYLLNFAHENYTFPEHRISSQIWIAMTDEPPFILQIHGLKFQLLNGIFNRTMSYRTDGDIFAPFGSFHQIERGQNIPTLGPRWVNSHDSIQTRNYAEGKSRLVAWFVSAKGCKSQSGRENYVKELQKYIQVDIYGECGTLKCGSRKVLGNPYKVEKDKCYRMVSEDYKFVLAFENTLCMDYVTEKMFNNLKLNVVPVVFGAANYSRFAPPHSVIDASRYTPKKLATYLHQLDKNDTDYNEYFRWKQDYQIVTHDGAQLVCHLCEQLNNPNWQVERKVYERMDEWITKGCREGYKYQFEST